MKALKIKLNVLVTDDDDSDWNAEKKVFGEDFRHFLCHWHVHENWKKKIKVEKLQAEIYAYLCACLQAPSKMLFSRYVEELVKKNFKIVMQIFCTIFKITTSVDRKFGQNVSG